MKRLLLSLVLTVSTMLSTVWAYDFSAVVSSGQTLYFNINYNTVSVTSPSSSYQDPYYLYTKPTGNLVIPATVTHNGTTYSVTSIGNTAFYNCSSLTSVTIPNSVTSIESSAFRGCHSLTSVTIPNSVTSIGNFAFYLCDNLNTLNFNAINCSDFSSGSYYQFRGCPISTINIGDSVQRIPAGFAQNRTELTYITIPNSVTSIGNFAFYNCTDLTSVTISNNVTSIGDSTFYECESLTSVTIPNSVTSIGNGAFERCSSLTSVTIPNSITSIGYDAFRGCSSLTTLNFNAINCSDFSSSHLPFSSCPISTINIGDSVQRIPEYFAYHLDSLSTLTIGNNVTTIGNYAFSGCNSLDTLNFNAVNCNDFSYSSSNPQTYPPFYNCPISTINIGNSVQHIPEYFAYSLNSLSSITIPNSVTSIGYSAFRSCSSLTSVTIPNSVTSIGSSAFRDCSSLISASIGNSVTSIGSSAFEDCSSLTSVTIPNSVTSIGSSAFRDCSSLTSVTIPNSVTSIGSSAFNGCSSLTSVTIPNSVAFIGESAFRGCSSLTTLNFNAINCSDFSDYYNYYSQYDYPPFYNCPISMINIGDSVQRIPANFAYSLDSLSSITIPNSVTSIGKSAFQNCSSLTSITIPNNVTSIGSSAFYNCTGLTSVTIPNSVTSIGSSVFQDCSSLTSVTIPNSVTTIGESAFRGCSSLTTLNFNAINCGNFSSYDYDYIHGQYQYCYPPFYNCPISTINIGDSVQRIPAYFAYNLDSLSSITIPNSVTSIGEEAFSDCSSLSTLNFNAINCSNFTSYHHPFDACPISTINIGDSVQHIPAYFVYNKNSLTNLTIGNSITTIESSTFSGCSSLTTLNFNAINCSDFSSGSNRPFYGCPISTITIGDSVQRIPAYFAYNKTALTSVTIGNSVTSIGSSAFRDCSGLTSVTIPNSVTSIGSSAFRGCSGLTSVTIGNSVTSIGSSAFYNCSSLTSVTIPNSIDTIRNYTFYNCSSLSSIITIPNSVTYIGESAFSGCSSLTSLTIPNSVTSIGESAFYNCSSLTSVTIPNSIDTIRNYTFSRCSNLTSITIPNSVTSIGNSAFYNCYRLTSVTIPNSVTSIGYDTFYNCSGLTSVTIPNSVTTIGSSAFYNCDGLTSVSIPNSVTYIGSSAFYGCSNLATLNFNAINCGNFSSYYTTTHNEYTYYYYPPFYNCPISVINIGDSVQHIPAYFAYNLDSLSSISIPNSVTSIGNSAFYGCSSLTAIIIPNNVTSIGDSTFNGCSNLRDVTSLATTPPSLGSSCFSVAGILKVPCGSLNSYRYSSWLDYFIIMEEICDNITITVSSANENMGTVSGGGEYAFGTQVTITATPNQGYRFVRWTDGNTNNPRTITATTNATYIATFEENTEPETYTITVMSANNSMGSVSGGGTYEAGSQITITATAVEGYHFTSWNDGNTDNPRTITVTEDATYIATFEEGVGIESIDILDNLIFYPNPTKGILNFSMDVEKIEVMDMMGKMVMQFCNVNEINIASLPKGVYCLRLSYNGKITVHKIIKE